MGRDRGVVLEAGWRNEGWMRREVAMQSGKELSKVVELESLTCGIVLDWSQLLKETTAIAQIRAERVIVAAQHATVMISPLPSLIEAGTVKSDVLNMKTNSPQAKKNPERASGGGWLGRVERGGPNHRKKYARHRKTATAASRSPHE